MAAGTRRDWRRKQLRAQRIERLIVFGTIVLAVIIAVVVILSVER